MLVSLEFERGNILVKEIVLVTLDPIGKRAPYSSTVLSAHLRNETVACADPLHVTRRAGFLAAQHEPVLHRVDHRRSRVAHILETGNRAYPVPEQAVSCLLDLMKNAAYREHLTFHHCLGGIEIFRDSPWDRRAPWTDRLVNPFAYLRRAHCGFEPLG